MTNRVMPDFDQWAKNILDRDELSQALKDAFEQGYNAGFMDGESNDWVEIWDDDYKNIEQN